MVSRYWLKISNLRLNRSHNIRFNLLHQLIIRFKNKFTPFFSLDIKGKRMLGGGIELMTKTIKRLHYFLMGKLHIQSLSFTPIIFQFGH